jgi:hypothetical protein
MTCSYRLERQAKSGRGETVRKLVLGLWALAACVSGLWLGQRLARAQQCAGTCIQDCNSVEIAPVGPLSGKPACKYTPVSPDGTSACDCGPNNNQPKDGYCRYETCKCNGTTSSVSQCQSQAACNLPGPTICSGSCP